MSWFKTKEKAALDAAVRAAAKPATRLVVERAFPAGHEFPPVSTRFGGAPYAEAGDTWPTWGGERRPYDFVCQIHLRDGPERPAAPFDLITVFLCWKAVEEVDFEGACRVRSHAEPSPESAVRLARPDPVDEDDYRVVACRVRPERALTYPDSLEGHPPIREAAAAFRDPHAALRKSHDRFGYRERFFSSVGGYPTWVHDHTLEGDDLVFLARIDYEPKARNCIGDAAPISIAFSARDPTRIETDVFQSF